MRRIFIAVAISALALFPVFGSSCNLETGFATPVPPTMTPTPSPPPSPTAPPIKQTSVANLDAIDEASRKVRVHSANMRSTWNRMGTVVYECPAAQRERAEAERDRAVQLEWSLKLPVGDMRRAQVYIDKARAYAELDAQLTEILETLETICSE